MTEKQEKKQEIIFDKEKIEFKTATYDYTSETLQAKVEKSKGLIIKGQDDKEGFDAVVTARKEFKNDRLLIEKFGKSLRKPHTDYCSKVSNKENRYIDIIKDREKELATMEKEYLEEQKKIKQEKKEAELMKVNDRLQELTKYKFSIDFRVLKELDDEAYDKMLEEVKINYEEELKKECLKLQEEKLKQEQLKKQQEELDKQKGEQEEAINKIREDQNKVNEEKNKLAQEELKRKATEQKKIDDAKEAEEAKRQAQLDKIEEDRQTKIKEENTKKYQEFLATHGITNETKKDFIVQRDKENPELIVAAKILGTIKI